MNNDLPNISVIIPCRNECMSIEKCVRSVLAQEVPWGDFEVIIVDGMSDDGTRAILQQLVEENQRVRVIDNPARIVSIGLNAAIRAASGKIIIRIDAHTEYASDYVMRCIEVLKETGADNVGGPARTKSMGYIHSAIRAAYHSVFAVGGSRFHNIDYEGPVDTVPYGCWHREVFERLGGFDVELVRNQDDELNLRIVRAGGTVWQSPRIKSWYTPRATLKTLFQQYMQYGYWKVRVIQKHRIPASPRHVLPGLFVLSVLLLPLLSFWSVLAFGAYVSLVGSYLVVNVTASILTAGRNEWNLFPVLLFVFPCYHFAYGFGFLHGVWDFVIRRRGPRPSQTKLTRISNAIHK